MQAAIDWMFILTLEWFGLPDERKRHGIQLEYGFKGKSNDELRQAWMAEVVPFMDEIGIEVPAHWDGERWSIDCQFPRAFDEETKSWGERDHLGRGDHSLEGARPDERGLRREAAARLSHHELPAGGVMSVEARLWSALREVEDPEIPISVVGMGLIVSLAYLPETRTADVQITYTAMGCPAMEFIEDDIREALLADPDVDSVDLEVVWDPVWTKSRIREESRATMRRLGIVA